MELRRDLLLGVGSLTALNLLVALVAIAAFTRMGPVSERMLREDVAQVQATEQMADVRAAASETRRLAQAGAWFSVLVAGFALVLSVLIIRRLTQRLLLPIRELWVTLEAARSGDQFRRCAAASPPQEIRRIFTHINEILDLHSKPRPWSERRAEADRAVVTWALRQRPAPTFVVDDRGQIFAANRTAQSLLGDSRGSAVRKALAAFNDPSRPSGDGEMQLSVEAVPEGKVWICEVREPPAIPPSGIHEQR
jgi:PAS domain-containing protein